MVAVEWNKLVDEGAPVQEWAQGVADEPGDVGSGKFAADEVNSRQGVDNVSEAAGFDDEDAHRSSRWLPG